MENSNNQEINNIGDILANRKVVKPPAYEWQDLALRIIQELKIPNFKRGSVFKVCKDMPKNVVEKALNDTKELCHAGVKWQYFFKVIASINTPKI
jgi:hypothetical protein